MADREFRVVGTADFRAILEGFKQVQAGGVQAGRQVEDSLKRAGEAAPGAGAKVGQLGEALGKIGAAAGGAGERLRGATGQFLRVGQDAAQANSKLGAMSASLGMVSQGLAGLGIGVSASAALAYSFRQMTAADDAAAAVRTLGINSDELSARLADVSRELGNNYSQIELTTAAYDVASSGFATAAQASDILKAAAFGAKGGFSDLGTVANALTSVINAYGLTSADAAKIVDGFIQTQNDGKIVLAEYGREIGNVAAIAAAGGISIDELNAAISAATANGVPVNQTFTGLRQAISAVLKPTAEATVLANKLGIQFNAQGLKAKGLGGLLEEVAQKTRGNVQQNSVLFSSVEALAAVQPLLNDGLAKYNDFLENQASASGAAAKASDEVGRTISGSLTRIKNAASDTTVALTKLFSPELEASATVIAKAFGALAGLAQSNGGLLKGSIEAAIPGLTGTGALLKLIAGLFKESGKEAGKTAVETGRIGQESGKAAGGLGQAGAASKALAAQMQAATAEGVRLQDQASRSAVALDTAALAGQRLQLSLQIGDSLIKLAQASQGLEQSRFDIAKARNQYELQAAQQRGASETEIEAIKRNGQLIEAQALQARAQSLLSIQELERQSLSLTQERARIDADLAVQGARVKQLEAEAAVQEAIGKGDERATALAQQKLELAQQVVQLEIQRRETLAQTQPIEQQIAAAGAETARNALQAQAAAMGLRLEANGTVTAMQGVNQSFQVLATSQGLTEGGQRRLRELAAATGLEVRQAADGTIQIGRSLGAAGTPAGQLVEALKNAADPAGAISGSFVKLGEKAPAAVQGSRDFAGYLSSAAGYSKQVSDPRIAGEVRNAATQAGSLADKMRTSASSAQSFYQSLLQASALPGSRWTGGPVEAGTSYRINELGQESLLGPGGQLSLINAPANSLWRAPRPGVVLPAGVTAQLKEQGVFGGGAGASLRGAGAAVAGGGAAEVLAQQAVEIGRLRQAISELARKTWNVGVKVRSDGSAVSFLNQMGRMR